MPKIIVTMPDGSTASHDLSEETATVGRLSDNTIQIEDASVSSHHAEITFTGGHHYLTDLDSTNGTRVNDRGFTKGVLHDGDGIIFGSIHVTYTSENPQNARPLPQQEAVAASVAKSSAKPVGFDNASPFKTKVKKKDPTATGIMAGAGVAILVFLAAAFMILQLQAQ